MAPSRLAEALVAEHSGDPDWLDEFSAELDRRRQGGALERILDVWGLSQSEAGRRFGVSRQAVAKWVSAGVPIHRSESISQLGAATDLLVHYLKRDRIPAVVRRPMDGGSLVDLLEAGRYGDVLESCREMFDFGAIPV
jgi:hypothetical protein